MGINQIVSDNIRFLAQRKNYGIGNLERELGLRIGYFSRKVSDDSCLDFKFVYQATQILDVSFNDLCDENLQEQFQLKDFRKIARKYGYDLVRVSDKK